MPKVKCCLNHSATAQVLNLILAGLANGYSLSMYWALVSQCGITKQFCQKFNECLKRDNSIGDEEKQFVWFGWHHYFLPLIRAISLDQHLEINMTWIYITWSCASQMALLLWAPFVSCFEPALPAGVWNFYPGAPHPQSQFQLSPPSFSLTPCILHPAHLQFFLQRLSKLLTSGMPKLQSRCTETSKALDTH